MADYNQISAGVADLQTQLDHIASIEIDPDRYNGQLQIAGQIRRMRALLRSAEASLDTCVRSLPPPPPVPLTLIVTGFRRFKQNDNNRGIISGIEDDKPYILAFAVDLSLPTSFTNSKLTRIGPISGVEDEGVFFAQPGSLTWGLSEVPQILSSAENLLCIVALMKNNDANPDQVREVTEINLQLRLATELVPFAAGQIPRAELVRRSIDAMNSILPIASAAIPVPDDRIGSAQELRFTQDELDTIYRDRDTIDKTIFFEGDDARYNVFFKMF